MNLLLVTAYYKPHMGGVENYVDRVAQALIAAGHKVTVLTSKLSPDDPYEEAEDDGRKVVRLPSRHFLGERYPLLLPSAQKRQFARSFPARHFDAVVVNTRYYPLSLYAAKLAHKNDVPCFVVDHSSSYLSMGSPLIDRVIKIYEHAATARLKSRQPSFFAVAQDGVNWLQTFGIEAQGTFHNAINAEEFVESASERNFREELSLGDNIIVAFTGRLIREKGVYTCLKVAKQLEGEGFSFIMAGDGPELEKLKQEAPSNLHLVGRLSTSDVAALLRQSDVFFFPSEYPEGFPTSLLEAAAAECAIVTTPIGGARDLIPSDENGIVLPPEASVSDMCEAIRNVASDKENRRGHNARRRVEENFTWEKTALAIADAATTRES